MKTDFWYWYFDVKSRRKIEMFPLLVQNTQKHDGRIEILSILIQIFARKNQLKSGPLRARMDPVQKRSGPIPSY